MAQQEGRSDAHKVERKTKYHEQRRAQLFKIIKSRKLHEIVVINGRQIRMNKDQRKEEQSMQLHSLTNKKPSK